MDGSRSFSLCTHICSTHHLGYLPCEVSVKDLGGGVELDTTEHNTHLALRTLIEISKAIDV